jgi:hypothetical protein
MNKGARQRVTTNKQSTVKRIKLGFSPQQSVTSFGGLAVPQRMMLRLGVDTLLARNLPPRRGYSLAEITVSAIAGLLSGAQGTVVTEAARHDPALRKLLGLSRSPEEATFWRSLEDAGTKQSLHAFSKISLAFGRDVLLRSPRLALMDNGFVPIFFDGSLLEGSHRREGTKFIEDKGKGLMWTAAFVGPYPVAQRLAASGEGESETTHARELLRTVTKDILVPTELQKDAMVLMDSLHGNGPTLDILEELHHQYIVGAGALKSADVVLSEQPESQWTATPEYDKRRSGIEHSAVCVATLQCEGWAHKRTIVGRRWKKKDEFIWNYSAVLTNLDPCDARLNISTKASAYARKIWSLYDRKGACENHFKNLLSDLGLHHPPCRSWQRNAGFYAIAMLTGLIAVACDVLTGKPSKTRRRIATLRRWLFAVPAHIVVHARTASATILGLSHWWRSSIEDRFQRACRC